MKKLVLNIVAAVLTVVGLGSVAALSPAVYAAPASIPGTDYIDEVKDESNGGNLDLMDTVQLIINAVIGIVGLIAVVMMIVGGISFITSQGDAAKVTKARNTILYGVVGLIVALLAFAIVNFVLGALFTKK